MKLWNDLATILFYHKYILFFAIIQIGCKIPVASLRFRRGFALRGSLLGLVQVIIMHESVGVGELHGFGHRETGDFAGYRAAVKEHDVTGWRPSVTEYFNIVRGGKADGCLGIHRAQRGDGTAVFGEGDAVVIDA